MREDGGLDKINGIRIGKKLTLFCRDYLVISEGKELLRICSKGPGMWKMPEWSRFGKDKISNSILDMLNLRCL